MPLFSDLKIQSRKKKPTPTFTALISTFYLPYFGKFFMVKY